MDANAIAAALGASLPGVQIEVAPSIDLQSTMYVQPENVIAVLGALRDLPELKFELLSEMTAIDFCPPEGAPPR